MYLYIKREIVIIFHKEVSDYLTYDSHGFSGLGAEKFLSPPGFKDHTLLTETSAGISLPLFLIFLLFNI